MSYLVHPVRDVDLHGCRDRVKAAHDYLVVQAQSALADAQSHTYVGSWGTERKRLRVRLSDEGKPDLVPDELSDHSLTEVYNQCATMERLIEALDWLIKQPQHRKLRVRICHPTTSSAPSEETDNDLVLEDRHGNVCACFEVSDIASRTKDGNRKEPKDLISLGVLRRAKGVAEMVQRTTWPEGRSLYLIVSEEFADYLRRPTRYWLKSHNSSPPHCEYVEVKNEGSTRIFEVRRGATGGCEATA